MKTTITEALAEIKTIQKRVAKRREGMIPYLARNEGVRDPLEKTGGSEDFIKRERQAVADMEARIVALRAGIASANDETSLTINGVTRSISGWLTWRREIAPHEQSFLGRLRAELSRVRDQAKRTGAAVMQVAAVATSGDAKPTDFVINIDEAGLAEQIDKLEDTLGQLDGLLSLKNATVTFEVKA